MKGDTISEGGFAVKKKEPKGRFVRVSRQQIEDHGAELGLEGLGLLLLLDLHANNESRKAFPGLTRLAKMGGTTRQRVERIIKRLDDINPPIIKCYEQVRTPTGRYRNRKFIILDDLGDWSKRYD